MRLKNNLRRFKKLWFNGITKHIDLHLFLPFKMHIISLHTVYIGNFS